MSLLLLEEKVTGRNQHYEFGAPIIDDFRPVPYFNLLQLENHLSDLLGIDVDLVRKEAIREELKETILRDTVTL